MNLEHVLLETCFSSSFFFFFFLCYYFIRIRALCDTNIEQYSMSSLTLLSYGLFHLSLRQQECDHAYVRSILLHYQFSDPAAAFTIFLITKQAKVYSVVFYIRLLLMYSDRSILDRGNRKSVTRLIIILLWEGCYQLSHDGIFKRSNRPIFSNF